MTVQNLNSLLSSFDLSGLKLKNRVVMAPMTRSRAGVERMPNPLMAKYYAQRAGAGLIITEASLRESVSKPMGGTKRLAFTQMRKRTRGAK